MTITSQYWPWYVAEYVISETRDGTESGCAIHTYLIKADTAELAYSEALSLQSTLGDAVRDSDGTVVEYRCLGLYDLDTLQSESMHHGLHLSVINWLPLQVPPVRRKHELALFV
jgi:hypothetical protein